MGSRGKPPTIMNWRAHTFLSFAISFSITTCIVGDKERGGIGSWVEHWVFEELWTVREMGERMEPLLIKISGQCIKLTKKKKKVSNAASK